MIIKKQSQLTGISHERDIDVTQEQLDTYKKGGVLLDRAFPHLDADDREFIKTGITPEEWEKYLSPPEPESEEIADE